ARRRLGERHDDRVAHRRSGAHCVLPHLGDARRAAAHAAVDLPDPDARRSERRRDTARSVDLRGLLPADAVRAERPALLGAEDGLASGPLNTSQQVGGAIGVAVASTVAITHATHLLHTGHSQAAALTSGYALAFWVVAGISAAGIVAALALVRDAEVLEAEPV